MNRGNVKFKAHRRARDYAESLDRMNLEDGETRALLVNETLRKYNTALSQQESALRRAKKAVDVAEKEFFEIEREVKQFKSKYRV